MRKSGDTAPEYQIKFGGTLGEGSAAKIPTKLGGTRGWGTAAGFPRIFGGTRGGGTAAKNKEYLAALAVGVLPRNVQYIWRHSRLRYCRGNFQ